MKRFLCILVSILMVLSFVACGDSSTIDKASSQAEKEASEAQASQKAESSKEETAETARTQGSTAESQTEATASGQDLRNGDIDVDLTKLSSTMVYSEVYNMMQHPRDYEGKMIKMKGTFSPYETEARNYYSCMIADATACCQSGIEFLWAGEHQYPNDYPPKNAEIVVQGIFEIYFEGDQMYVQLKDAALTF